MADHGSREQLLAHPAGAKNPLLPTLTFTASHSDIESLIRIWDRDIVRAAHAVVARDCRLSNDAAEECAQAARLALARIAHRAAEVGPFYLRRVVQNAVRGVARGERRMYGCCIPAGQMASEVSVDVIAEEPDDAISGVIQWITTLPCRLRELYDLLYVRGYSQRTAAKLMHISQPRVAQLHRDLLAQGMAVFSSRAA